MKRPPFHDAIARYADTQSALGNMPSDDENALVPELVHAWHAFLDTYLAIQNDYS